MHKPYHSGICNLEVSYNFKKNVIQICKLLTMLSQAAQT